MFLSNNKRKIAVFVLFFFLFSFPIKLKESYANPVALEVVMWGVAAVLTAAGIMVDTGDTESLIYATQEYWKSLKEPERKMYETMAIHAKEDGNVPLSDYLWSRANSYVNSNYNEGSNVINIPPNVYDGNIEYGKIYNISEILLFNNPITIGNYYYEYKNGQYYHNWPINIGSESFDVCQGTSDSSYLGNYSISYTGRLDFVTLGGGRIRFETILNIGGNYTTHWSSYDFARLEYVYGKDLVWSVGLSEVYNLEYVPVSETEFTHSTPVPPGVVPERRIAYPSHVFNPNNDIDGILEPLTGKTAQDIWGAAGAYTSNTTTFDPVSGDNPILPWVPIADPSTFTPAGELPAEISATAPGVLNGTNSDLNSISGSLGSIWDILKTGFNALIDTIWTGISHLLDGLGSISLLLKSVFDLINSGISAIVGAISSIWDLVYDGFASVAAALRGILDQVANVVGYLNPASDTFFLRTALVPDVAVLNGFVESLNINFQEKFQIAAAYEEFQSYKNTDHESEFEDIYVDLPIWGMQCICKGEFVNTAGQQFKSVVAAFLIMLTVIFCFKRIATIGSK